MDPSGRETDPHFALPIRQITFMVIVIALCVVGGYFVIPSVAPVFLSNPWLNGFIATVFVIGVLACFWQVFQLIASVKWIKLYASDQLGADPAKAPRLLASTATLLRSRGSRMQISATSSRTILDSVATRVDEARDITRYLVNLLIFLGLLGTFYGLATTVPAVVETIRSLAPQQGEDAVAVLGRLMGGLEKQLGGMGTAFGSSLLGLAGSLIVGLLELFASQSQNRFYRELEDWLSSITRLGLAGADGETSGDQGAMASLLDQMVDQMEALQRLFLRADEGRALTDETLSRLSGSLDALTDRLGQQPQPQPQDEGAAARLAEGQERLIEVMEKQATGGHLDAESRMRLRSIDVQLLRLLEEMSAGRQESLAELRSDLASLARAIRTMGAPAPRPRI